VFRTGSRFGAGHIVDVLLGKATDKVKEWQHDQVSTFGIGTDMDDKSWRTLIRQLVAHGALAVDHERYGALILTEAARPLLRGESRFTMRLDVARPKKRTRGETTVRNADWPSPHSAEGRLLDALRQWRSSKAKERNVPTYVIFHDATLRDIARQRPASLDTLATISGVGDRKLNAYGDEILALLEENA
jgi:ATP-dependent DNA helicase RecQ